MSVLIEGMEMPRNCAHCRMWDCCPALHHEEWPDYESIITNDVIGDGGAGPGVRHPDCPLIEVPEPHGDLIDRDKLRAKEFIHNGDAYAVVMSRDIRNAPTIIPATEERET